MFTVAGVSRLNGSLKLRFANDFVTRSKKLARSGHTDINLVELPQAMTKDAAVAYISTLNQFADIDTQAVISEFHCGEVGALRHAARRGQQQVEPKVAAKVRTKAAAKTEVAEIA